MGLKLMLGKKVVFWLLLGIAVSAPYFTYAEVEDNQIAGEIFGEPVPIGNYYFLKTVVLRFSANWRGVPKDEKELEDLVWQEIILSYEAFRRGIVPSGDEVNVEIDKMLDVDKAEFNWKEDKQAYQEWVNGQLEEPVEVFENQVKHLVTIEKLRNEILDSIEPDVIRDEAYQKFLDEYNSLGVELIQFSESELGEAEKFYKQVKSNPGLWDKKKEERKENFKNLKGPFALDFLINLWGFRRDDAEAMIKMKEGQFYKPSPIYKGCAVFKVLSALKADTKVFDERKEYYYDKIRMIKKYEGYKQWVEDLKERANIKVLIQ